MTAALQFKSHFQSSLSGPILGGNSSVGEAVLGLQWAPTAVAACFSCAALPSPLLSSQVW